MDTYESDTVATLGAIESFNAHLQGIYKEQRDQPRSAANDNGPRIAELQQAIGRGFKRAEVLALLSIGERIEALTRAVEAQRITPTEIDYLLAHPENGI